MLNVKHHREKSLNLNGPQFEITKWQNRNLNLQFTQYLFRQCNV